MHTMIPHECDWATEEDSDSSENKNSDDELLALIYGDESSSIASVMLVNLVYEDGTWHKKVERKLVLPNT